MKNIFKLKESEKNRIRKLHESHKSFHGTSLINEQITSSSSGVDLEGNVTKIETTKAFEFPPEIAGEKDNIKRIWFCMDDKDNRGWNLDEDAYQRFQLLWYGIEGHGIGLIPGAGTDEEVVWAALSGHDPEEQGEAAYPIKGGISGKQLKNMLPILSCMKSDRPWEQDYMEDNDLEVRDVSQWILADSSGMEKCLMSAYLRYGGKSSEAWQAKKDCGDRYGWAWWDKATNWVKGLF